MFSHILYVHIYCTCLEMNNYVQDTSYHLFNTKFTYREASLAFSYDRVENLSFTTICHTKIYDKKKWKGFGILNFQNWWLLKKWKKLSPQEYVLSKTLKIVKVKNLFKLSNNMINVLKLTLSRKCYMFRETQQHLLALLSLMVETTFGRGQEKY